MNSYSRANDNDDQADNLSLSSIDDFPDEVPEAQKDVVPQDRHVVSIADILLNPGRKRRPRK